MSLFDSLGLDNVSSDPNAIPDNMYQAIVSNSEYKYVESKDELNHVISFKILGPSHQGVIKQEWFLLAKGPTKQENGQWGAPFKEVPSEQRRSFHVRRLNDLGVPNSRFAQFEHTDIIGTEVKVTVKTNGQGYQNISAVQRDEGSSISLGGDHTTPGTGVAAEGAAPSDMF